MAVLSALSAMSERSRAVIAALLLAGALLAMCVVVLHPLQTASVGYDAAFSIIYFDRLVAGRFTEVMPATTPKPLITLLSGSLYHLGGWALLTWASIGAFIAGVVAAAALAHRLGGLVAGAMTAAGLAGTMLLLLDVNLAYATPWALLGWSVAGLALTSARPRHLVAGIALLAAALCRVETFLLLGTATAVLVASPILARRGLIERLRPRAWLVLVGWLALPVMLVHDQLAFGDPLLWLKLAHINSTANMTVSGLMDAVISRYTAEWGLLALALVGLLDLGRRRQWIPFCGLVSLGLGNLALLFALILSSTYVSFRYYLPTDMALVFAASLGTAAITRWVVPWATAAARRRGLGRSTTGPADDLALDRIGGGIVAVMLGAGLAIALVRPFAPLDRTTRAVYDSERLVAADLERAMPVIRQAVAALPSPPTLPDRPLTAQDRPGIRSGAPPPRVRVPGILWPRATVDLRLALWDVTPNPPVPADPSTFRLQRTTIVYFDRVAIQAERGWKALAVSSPTRVGHVLVVPLMASGGVWVERLEPAG